MKKRVCVSGLGNVGLPAACILALSGYLVSSAMPHDAIVRAEIIVGLVPHHALRNIHSHLLEGKIILDFAGVFA